MTPTLGEDCAVSSRYASRATTPTEAIIPSVIILTIRNAPAATTVVHSTKWGANGVEDDTEKWTGSKLAGAHGQCPFRVVMIRPQRNWEMGQV